MRCSLHKVYDLPPLRRSPPRQPKRRRLNRFTCRPKNSPPNWSRTWLGDVLRLNTLLVELDGRIESRFRRQTDTPSPAPRPGDYARLSRTSVTPGLP